MGDTPRLMGVLPLINPNDWFLFLQLVWARTYAVGCGSFRCQELEGAEDVNENALFFVCTYGPG